MIEVVENERTPHDQIVGAINYENHVPCAQRWEWNRIESLANFHVYAQQSRTADWGMRQ